MFRFKGLLAIDGSAWDRESEAAFALTRALAVKPSPLALDACCPRVEAPALSSSESTLERIDGEKAGAETATLAVVPLRKTFTTATNSAEIATAAIVAITRRDNTQ